MRIFAALGLSALGSAGGLLLASLFLLVHERGRSRVLPSLISYAVGTLLGAALLALLPEAVETERPSVVFASLLTGIFTFFILEKLVLWRHCHDLQDCQIHKSTATLVIVGDATHALVDGAVIAAAVLVSFPLGITTALAIAAHEVPQQVGDVAILLAAGYSRVKAFGLNLIAGAGAVAGAALMVMFGEATPGVLPYVLGFAAGNFLYVAMADLIPHLHRGIEDANAFRQIVMIAAGIATIVAL